MRRIREVIRLSQDLNLSISEVSNSLDIARSTVRKFLDRAKQAGLSWPLPDDLDDRVLEERLFPRTRGPVARRPLPDWAEVHREMQCKGATLTVIHEEYLAANPGGLQRSQFFNLYNTWLKSLKSYLRQSHVAGQNVYVDYAGPTIPVHDAESGTTLKAQIFVGVLGASNYVFAEATWSQSLPDWIGSNRRMFEFFGGAARFLICDNLKAAVTRPSLTDPLVNDTFQSFAAHYNATVVPARAYRPKDKSKAEGHVLVVERWIVFRLRKRVFTSLGELNAAIAELLDELNQRPFQKLPGNRLSAFESIDRPALVQLPACPYEYVEFRRGRVGMDRMVKVDGRSFSVPAQLVNEILDIRVTAGVVELSHRGWRVASHAKRPGTDPVIDPAHLTEADRAFAYWTPDREYDWAESIGPNTFAFVKRHITAGGSKTLAYRLGNGLRKLAAEHGHERLESTCGYALQTGASKLKSLKVILERSLDRRPPPLSEASFEHENLRGPDYYH